MILSDQGIIAWATAGGIEPFYSANVQPSSIDVSVGDSIMVEQRRANGNGSTMAAVSLADYSQGDPYLIMPDDFAVILVEEKIDMGVILSAVSVTGVDHAKDGPFGRHVTPPAYALSAKAYLKSTPARAGLELLQAGWAEAGFVGNLSLAVKNVRRWEPMPVWPGKLFAQLVIQAHRIPMDQYNGHYQNANRVMTSWDAAH